MQIKELLQRSRGIWGGQRFLVWYNKGITNKH